MDSILTQGGIDLKCSQHWIRRASERAAAPNWIPYRFSRDPGTLVIILNRAQLGVCIDSSISARRSRKEVFQS